MLKRKMLVLLAALGAILLLATSGAYGAATASGGGPLESPTGAWFVGLDGSADSFRAKAKASKLEFNERFEFKTLWKGLSVEADADTAAALRSIDGVVSVSPVGIASIPPTETVSEPELIHALAMTGADVAQNELGLSGRGVKVGVMDTGIDYNNPAFGGCFGTGCRVSTGFDFVGDRFDAGGSGGALRPHPDSDPDDCQGHGSHVAGIVGGNGTVNGVAIKGVAPGVVLGAYRVFGCEGSTSDDIMIAAMERALADGMDILNLSIGDAFAWDTDPVALAMNSAVDRGMIVVISAGNSGANGLYSLSSAGNAEKVIGVASMDNTHIELPVFTVSPDGAQIGYQQATAAGTAPTSGVQPIERTGTSASTSDACAIDAATAAKISGKVALIRRGGCTFYEKARNAQAAGAAGVVIYNNAPGRIGSISVEPGFAGFPGGPVITIPVVNIAGTEGNLIDARLATGPVTITWTDDLVVFPNATAGQPSSFTSWGLAPSLNLKPDIAAPGGFIKSAYPLEKGGFTTISGTSMAAPHVAGAAALYVEAHGDIGGEALREIFQNSADPAIAGLVAPGTPAAFAAHRQGAGMIDIDDAILSSTRVTPGKLALGEGTAAQAKTLTIRNNGSSAVTYTLSHLLGLGTTSNTFAPGNSFNFASVSFNPSSVEVPAGGERTVEVTITPVATAIRTIYSGYLVVTGGNQTLRVPYAGFVGDYQSIVVLAPGACSFPGVFKAGGQTTCGAATLTGWTRQTAGATYNVEERSGRPVLLFHLAHQSERVEVRAVNASGQEFLVARTDLAERSPTQDLSPTGFFVYTWDGKAVFTNANGNVNRRGLPSGTYTLRIVVSKARQFGDTSGPVLETWTSPALNIVSG